MHFTIILPIMSVMNKVFMNKLDIFVLIEMLCFFRNELSEV